MQELELKLDEEARKPETASAERAQELEVGS